MNIFNVGTVASGVCDLALVSDGVSHKGACLHSFLFKRQNLCILNGCALSAVVTSPMLLKGPLLTNLQWPAIPGSFTLNRFNKSG